MIVESGLKGTTLPSIIDNLKKSKTDELAAGKTVVQLYCKRAESLLKTSPEYLGEKTKMLLKGYLTKLEEAEKSKNMLELDAYARTLPKLVIGVDKEAYKAKKKN